MKCGLFGIVHPSNAVLPPEALQRRDHIFKETLDFVFRLIAHFEGVSHGIQNPDSRLISAAILIGVPLPADSNIVRLGDGNDLRLAFRHVEFFVFLFEVESHKYTP